MSHVQWAERRVALEKKLAVMRHFIAKCKDSAKKAVMQKEMEALDTDFQKSKFFEEVTKRAEQTSEKSDV